MCPGFEHLSPGSPQAPGQTCGGRGPRALPYCSRISVDTKHGCKRHPWKRPPGKSGNPRWASVENTGNFKNPEFPSPRPGTPRSPLSHEPLDREPPEVGRRVRPVRNWTAPWASAIGPRPCRVAPVGRGSRRKKKSLRSPGARLAKKKQHPGFPRGHPP